jgi:hypothetical protein
MIFGSVTPGFIKNERVSCGVPDIEKGSNLIAPNSIIRSFVGSIPVVSKSNDMNMI